MKTHKWWRSMALCAVGLIAIALVTLLTFRLQVGFGIASFCYLVLLVIQSLSGDFLSSLIVSFVAVACLDYFFTVPLFSFEVMSPFDAVGLSAFLITCLIITRLVTNVRVKTESSRLQQEILQRLYDLAQQMLALEPDEKGGSQFLEPFLGLFGIKAACLFDAANAEVYIAGTARDDLEKKTGEAFIHGKDCEFRENGVAAQCIEVRGRTVAAIGLRLV
jgi:two-component system, OmpR family, sensor histidine kinase KdpD